MNQDDQNRDRDVEDLDEQMERETEIRRDTQVRGSLGIPPSGQKRDRSMDEGVPEFDRLDDEDRASER